MKLPKEKGYIYINDDYYHFNGWAEVLFYKKVEWEKVVALAYDSRFNEHIPKELPLFHKVNINDIVFDENKVNKFIPYVEPTPPNWEFCVWCETSFSALNIRTSLTHISFKLDTDNYEMAVDNYLVVKDGKITSSEKPVGVEWMPAYLDWKIKGWI